MDDFYCMSRDEMLDGRTEAIRNAFKKCDDDCRESTNYVPNVIASILTKQEYTFKDPFEHKPRLITGHEPEYFMFTGPLGLSVMKWFMLKCYNGKNNLYYTGGSNMADVGDFVHKHEQAGYVPYEWDHEKFDASIAEEALDIMFDFMVDLAEYAIKKSKDVSVNEALKWLNHLPAWRVAMKNSVAYDGRFKLSGVRVRVPGTVHSGMWSTSTGNTLLNSASMLYVLWKVGVNVFELDEFSLAALGDDGLLFLRNALTQNQLLDVRKEFLELGMDAQGVGTALVEAKSYDHLEYCSGRFWKAGGTRVLGPKPFRWLAKAFHLKRCWSDEEAEAVLRGITADPNNHYVPVVGEICAWILSKIDIGGPRIIEKEWKGHAAAIGVVRDDETLGMFENLYGYTAKWVREFFDSLPEFELGIVLDNSLLASGLEVDGCNVQGDRFAFGSQTWDDYSALTHLTNELGNDFEYMT